MRTDFFVEVFDPILLICSPVERRDNLWKDCLWLNGFAVERAKIVTTVMKARTYRGNENRI